jgi:hypothetical protein
VRQGLSFVFLRPVIDSYGGGRSSHSGVIFLGEADGSHAVQLTPGDVEVSFVGIADANDSAILYYVEEASAGASFRLQRRDLSPGKTTTVATIEPLGSFPSGTLSPDGRRTALFDHDGLDVIDAETGSRQRLLTHDLSACEDVRLGDCRIYTPRGWSPDGQMLLVDVGFYEGGTTALVDLRQQPPKEIESTTITLGSAWSPPSDAFCTTGAAIPQTRGLFIAKAPEWEPQNVLEQRVYSCVWVDDHRIAVVVPGSEQVNGFPQPTSAIGVFDTSTGQLSVLTEFGRPSLELVDLSNGHDVIFTTAGPDGRPQRVGLADGSRAPLLQPGDRLLGVVPAAILPARLRVATPPYRDCGVVTGGCEVKVVNVGSGGLAIQSTEETTQKTEVLAQGDHICLPLGAYLMDGAKRWRITTETYFSGWIAQGDPQVPDKPFLEATGRRCRNG